MRVILSAMSRVHDVLRWANRRDVAREVTKRGYRVSGETLNRWVRDEAEFPAVVEQIVYELFTISGHEEAPPPTWAGAMEGRIVSEVQKNREALYARLAGEAAEKALRLAGLLPDEPSDGTRGQPPSSTGPSKGPGI